MIPVRMYIYGAILLCAAAGAAGLYWKGKTAGEARGEDIAQAALRERDSAIAALEASQKASEGYANELEAIRNRPAARQPVRLCVAPKPVQVPAAPAGTDEVPAAPEPLSGQPGPDIGDRLRDDARRADELAAQLRALQEWIGRVSQ